MFKAAIIGLVIVLAGVARAETPIPEAEADDLMRQGLELRRQGQNAKALDSFSERRPSRLLRRRSRKSAPPSLLCSGGSMRRHTWHRLSR